MSLLDKLFSISIKESNDKITIFGLDPEKIADDFKTYWNTSKISDHMLGNSSFRKVVIEKFFVPDIIFAINHMLNDNGKNKRRIKNRHTLQRLHDALIRETSFINMDRTFDSRLDWSRLDDLVFKPLTFQEEFLKIYDQRVQQMGLNGYLLAATAGSGKTNTALTLMHLLKKEKIVIVSPSNAVFNVWVKHLEEKSFKTPQKTGNSRTGLDPKLKYNVVHYEYLEKATKELESWSDKDVAIILDESHNFNEITSARVGTFIKFCKQMKSKDVLLLSGTPIKAIPTEAIPLFRAIDPTFSQEAEEAFKKIFRQNNLRGVEILSNRLGLVSFKVQKQELGLKEPIFHDLMVKFKNSDYYTLNSISQRMKEFIEARLEFYSEMREEHEAIWRHGINLFELDKMNNASKIREYLELAKMFEKTQGQNVSPEAFRQCREIENEIIQVIKRVEPDLLTQWLDVRSAIKYVTLKIRGECLGRVVGRARIDCHVEMAKVIDYNLVCETSTKKTVVFSSFVEVVEELINKFHNDKINGIYVYAKTNKDLPRITTRFAEDDSVNPLVATYKSLSTAVPLTMADTMILIDMPFRDYILQQAVSRIHRLDSDTQTHVYVTKLDTGGEPNISARTSDILKWSQKQIAQIIGIQSPFELSDDNDSLDMAIESYCDGKQASSGFLNW